MKIFTCRVLSALVLTFACLTNAQAALIANGDYTTDTATGLDWLDPNLTLGFSIESAMAQTGMGGLFEGYAVADQDQVETLLINAGWIGPFDSGNVLNTDFVANLGTQMTNSFVQGTLGGLLFPNDSDPNQSPIGIELVDSIDAETAGLTSYTEGRVTSSFSDPTVGVFMFTASAVPVPGAVWLFGSGLLGLIGIARRKKAA